MTLCIPQASGVPGLGGQPPTWPGIDAINGHTSWPTAAPSISTPFGLDDPRWAGHLAIGYPEISTSASGCGSPGPIVPSTFGSATDDDAAFRALYDVEGTQDVLYLSWWVKADDSVDHSEDVLYVGFERRVGDPMLIEIQPFTSNVSQLATSVVTSGVVNVHKVHTTAGGGMVPGQVKNWDENGGDVPVWIEQNTHVWLDIVSNRWAVQMRVPIGAGSVDTEIDLGDTFDVWFEMRVELPDSTIVPYSWPRSACVVDTIGFPPTMHVPDPATWEAMHLRDGAADPACPATGYVTLTTADVGTSNSPTSQINLLSANTFEARPRNETGATVGANEISAEFRIANWGSVADPLAPWTLIPATPNPASNPSSITDGSQGTISMSWTLTAQERADYDGSPFSTHQCMLVTLTGAHEFSPASVWRNMDFVSASRFQRVATLSNVGLGPSPLPTEPRPAYVLVTKLNMPATVDPDRPGDDRPDDDQPPGPIDAANATGGGGEDRRAMALLAKAALDTESPIDRRELTQPTIRYHTYHDTGVDVTRNNKTYRVLRPGTGFGYWVEHQGALFGWQDELQGATRITENFYELAIPEEGSVEVVTVVEALETDPNKPPDGCLVALFKSVVRFLRRLFRRP